MILKAIIYSFDAHSHVVYKVPFTPTLIVVQANYVSDKDHIV